MQIVPNCYAICGCRKHLTLSMEYIAASYLRLLYALGDLFGMRARRNRKEQPQELFSSVVFVRTSCPCSLKQQQRKKKASVCRLMASPILDTTCRSWQRGFEATLLRTKLDMSLHNGDSGHIRGQLSGVWYKTRTGNIFCKEHCAYLAWAKLLTMASRRKVWKRISSE